MKKTLIMIIMICLISLGCGKNVSETKNNDEIKVINDNVFIQMTDDMFFNSEDYESQIFQIEGLMLTEPESTAAEGVNPDKLHYFIVRKTPGCCGNDGLAGLEISYNGTIPEDETWVVGKGIWKPNGYSSYNGWILELYSLEALETRGNEFLEYNY